MVVVIVIVALVAMAFATGELMYRLAPAAGFSTEEERGYYRDFGREWGWLTPVPVLIYWFLDVHDHVTTAYPGDRARRGHLRGLFLIALLETVPFIDTLDMVLPERWIDRLEVAAERPFTSSQTLRKALRALAARSGDGPPQWHQWGALMIEQGSQREMLGHGLIARRADGTIDFVAVASMWSLLHPHDLRTLPASAIRDIEASEDNAVFVRSASADSAWFLIGHDDAPSLGARFRASLAVG